MTAVCVSRAAAKCLDPAKKRLKWIHRRCEAARAGAAGQDCGAPDFHPLFLAGEYWCYVAVSGDAGARPALLQHRCKTQPERTDLCEQLVHKGQGGL